MRRKWREKDEQQPFSLDYHLQKYNFMINDSFVLEKKSFFCLLSIFPIHVHGMIIIELSPYSPGFA